MALRKGQMIVEVVVAFTITVIALVGLLQLTRRSVGSAGGAGRTSAATAYANAGMEWITNEKILNGWAWLRNKCTPPEPTAICNPTLYCLNTLAWTAGACTGTISNTEFSRDLTLTMFIQGTTRVLKAKVIVGWVEGQRSDSVTRTFEFVE